MPVASILRKPLVEAMIVVLVMSNSSGATRPQDAPWKLGIVLGDCWRVLRGHGQALNSDVQQRFVEFCPSAIDHEAPIKDRVELALALGRIGNPRVPSSLNDPQAWVELPARTYQLGEADSQYALTPETFTLSEPVKISRYLVTRRCNSREADLGCTSPVGSFPRGRSWCGVAGFAPQHARQLSAALRASLDFLRLV